jgi:hypothetical protein
MSRRFPTEVAGELIRLPSGEVRATDAERERTAERLRRAYADGCLEYDELDERVSKALVARTRSDLRRLVRDLPRDREIALRVHRAALRTHGTVYVMVNSGLVATWAAMGGAFWPAGSIAPWGSALLLHWMAVRRGTRRRRGPA